MVNYYFAELLRAKENKSLNFQKIHVIKLRFVSYISHIKKTLQGNKQNVLEDKKGKLLDKTQ